MIALPKPLSEDAFSEVAMTLRILVSAERHIENCIGQLDRCKVPFDHAPFKQVMAYLGQSYDAANVVVVAHLDAIDAIDAQKRLSGSAVAQ